MKPITVTHCARCGGDHVDLEVHEFVNPIDDEDGLWRFWATCPTTGDPILIRILDVPSEEK